MSHCPNFKNVSVLVVGDVMLDRFWSGSTARVSPEAPVPVVAVTHNECRAGGAGNVAVNIARLGAKVVLSGISGADESADLLRAAVEAAGVTWSVCPAAKETIVKLRVLSRNQQLLRMDFEQSLACHADDLFTAQVKPHLATVDVVVLSDYAKGTLNQVEEIIRLCREAGKPVLVDPKGQDLSRYSGATLLTPNLSEFEAVVGPCDSEDMLLAKGEALRESLNVAALLVTRSERGMTLFHKEGPPISLPAKAREVYDVTGAGDTVISVMASAMAAGESLESAMALANTAAGLVVGKLGTASVTPEELEMAVSGGFTATTGPSVLVEEAILLQRVTEAKAAGQRVVMTNGCFDLLHRGHVDYLIRARELGDKLIVAINSDASVKRLKGDSRPVTDVESRASILSALRCVDWVTVFDTDTPADLIAKVLPDVLVKGGDYRPEDIVGGDAVITAGGEVRVLDFVDGFSTTAIIDKLSS
jgi:D-beta-D-heptose 7-phosphate kinase/D-beta-D-heptose 1-phosphate adenosyltransferase